MSTYRDAWEASKGLGKPLSPRWLIILRIVFWAFMLFVFILATRDAWAGRMIGHGWRWYMPLWVAISLYRGYRDIRALQLGA